MPTFKRAESGLLQRRLRRWNRPGQEPTRRMKKPVCQGVDFQTGNGSHRVASDVAHHVVPLKHLVKHNAINEAPRPKPNNSPNTLGGGRLTIPGEFTRLRATGGTYLAMHWTGDGLLLLARKDPAQRDNAGRRGPQDALAFFQTARAVVS